MKTKYFKIIIITMLLGLLGCESFLDENPKHLVTIENYYKTEQDAISAVNSLYAYLNSYSAGSTAGVYHSTFWVTAGLASDELLNNQIGAPYFDQLDNFSYRPKNTALEEIWEIHYKTISLANIAINRIPSISMDENLKKRLIAEAQFLRALLYFNLVRMYGEVPLILKEDAELYPVQNKIEVIYEQIIKDLSGASEVLPKSYPAGAGRGRATWGAAKSLLSKVYLTISKWDLAAQNAKEVIDSKEYSLWQDFADVFKLSSRSGKESIFSVGFGDGGGAISFWEAGQFLVRLLPPELSVEGVQNAQGWQVPTQYLYNSFQVDDRRRSTTFITKIRNPDGTIKTIRPYIKKYWDKEAEPQGNESSNDFQVIRYAEVLLIYAEALNEKGGAHTDEALKYINMVRKRARYDGSAYQDILPDYNGLNQEETREAILTERMYEFVAEGKRWFDLVRYKKLEAQVKLAKPTITPTPKHYLFPIPQYEIDLNKNLVQNPNY